MEGHGERYAPFLSPEHRLSVVVLFIFSSAAFIYSSYRRCLAPPLTEVLVNCFLLAGVVCAIAFMVQDEWIGALVVNLPFVLQSIQRMADNHRMAVEQLNEQEGDVGSGWVRDCRRILLLPAWKKLPLLPLLCIPVLWLLSGVLLLFSQKPDSLVRAFTDKYSNDYFRLYGKGQQPDYYGAHYLCTIAAKGHPGLVRPIRMRERRGRPIRCNRQLLVSNAFEELLEQRVPRLHRWVRRVFDKIGAGIHRHYWVFDHAWVSDLVYLAMKPVEWFFVVVLYLGDRRPEDRIGRQYLKKEDRLRLNG